MSIVKRLTHVLIIVLTLIVGAAAAAIIASQTAWFKNWLRGYIVREANQYLNGTLSIERLGGNLLFGVEMENIAVSLDGTEVVAVKDLGLDYSVFELISKGLSVDSIRLDKPVIYLRRQGDTWSLSRLVKKQETEADRSGPAKPISIAAIGISDGEFVVDGPVGTSGVEVPKRFEHLDAKMSFKYEPVRYSIEITHVSFRGTEPAIALNALSGGIAVHDDSVHVEKLSLRTAETSLSIDGAVQNYLTKPNLNLQITSDKLSIPEIARLVPALAGVKLQPAFELKLNGPADRLGVDMNVRSSAGNITGNVVATGRARVLPDIRKEPDFLNRIYALKLEQLKSQISFFCIPIRVEGRTAGALSCDKEFVSDEQLHGEVSLRLARLQQRYTPSRRAIVEALADAGRPLTVPEILAVKGDVPMSSAYRNVTVLTEALNERSRAVRGASVPDDAVIIGTTAAVGSSSSTSRLRSRDSLKRKATLLLQLIDEQSLILAFDSRPISLAQIRNIIQKRDSTVEVVFATGDPASERGSALETFALGSSKKRVIGLCSDSLSEGVNFQQAGALVHLDMPSVVRVAEQRVGRIDRLDSPHPAIEAWWPDDAPEFGLSSDERFIERYDTVEALLGSNMPFPDELREEQGPPVNVRDLVAEYESEAARGSWDGIQDAFQPVRGLVEGNTALVDEKTYEYYRTITARIVSRVSLVRSPTQWAFFCLAGGEFGAPRWLYMPGLGEQPQTELEAVSDSLRKNLTPDTKDLPMNDSAARYLQECVAALDKAERSFLSPRKQRALEEMEVVLRDMLRNAATQQKQLCVEELTAILDALTRPEPQAQPDWDEIAARWLDLIRPIWYERLKRPRPRPLLLKDIRRDVLNAGESFRAQVLQAFESIPILQTPDERIAACIIGVPN